MVAETVKSYNPYTSLPLLAQQDINYSCSSLQLPSYPPSQQSRMDRNPILPGVTPSGLSAGGLIPGPPIIKDNIFSQRKQREFIPDNKKDDSYWDRRRRNNEAAKRSREKRRFNDMILEQRVLELSKENHLLKAKLTALETKYQTKGDGLVNEDQVLASMPHSDQILALTRRSNISLLGMSGQSPLLSPNSPQSHTSTSSNMQDDDQYHHHQEISYGRSHSPDDNDSSQHQQQSSYSPEPNNSYYDVHSPAALNLSARSSRSPATMDFCEEQLNRASEYSLPHKLRHKNAQQIMRHCGSPASEDHHSMPPTAPLHFQQSALRTSPSSGSHLMYPIKSEPISREGEESPTSSSPDRDSGVSVSPTLPGEPSYPLSRDIAEDMELDNEQLRAQVERLTNEVHNIKHILNRNTDRHPNRR